MRIAIVSNSPPLTELLRALIVSERENRVAWVAGDGAAAVDKCTQDKPDLVLLATGLPGLDAPQTTKAINRRSPCPILLLAPAGHEHSGKVFEAMGSGALDVSIIPVELEGRIHGGPDLLKKISTIAKLTGERRGTRHMEADEMPKGRPDCSLVAIGASTGGPRALALLLGKLPKDLGACVVIAQHVDVQFSMGLAEWLRLQTGLRIRTSYDGIRPEPNTVLLAATNDHLVLGPDTAFHHAVEPDDYPYRPSVDSLFLSLERHWPYRDIAVLLTGMGRDGARGLLALRRAGWHTIAQDEASSTVFGMPRAAIESEAAVEVLPLHRIAASVERKVRRKTERETYDA